MNAPGPSARGIPLTDRSPARAHPTVGELMDNGRRHVTLAHAHMSRRPFASTAQARTTIAARAALVGALADNARAVIGPARFAAITGPPLGRRTQDTIDPNVRRLLTWIALLDQSRPARTDHADTTLPESDPDLGRAARLLLAARTAITTATDLTLTHYQPTGAARPDVDPILASSSWGALLIDVARIVALVAPVEPLALRCRQAGMTRAEIDRHLPVNDPLVERTWALAAAWGFPPPALRDLTVSHPAIRTSDPAAEWTDRMRHLYMRMLAHRDAGHAGVRTLQDIARLGTVVSHVLATSGHGHADQAQVTSQWLALTAHLAPLRSTEPGDRTIRSTVEQLLHVASPTTTSHAPAARTRLLAAITASSPVLDDCAVIAARLMATSTDLWLPARATRPYLRSVNAASTRARRPAPVPHPWPRTTRTTSPTRTVGLA